MTKKKFQVPFQFCKLDRAVRFLNESFDLKVEVEDLLNYAINQHIVLHSYNSASPVCNLSLSAKDFAVLKRYFKFHVGESHTYFDTGNEKVKRAFAVSNDCAEFDGIPGLEESRGEVGAYITGYWPLLAWIVEKIYFNCSTSLKNVTYPIGGLLHFDLFSHFITVFQTLDIDSIVIFSEELEKVHRHLAGTDMFSAEPPNLQESFMERSAEAMSLEKHADERATLSTSALIAALLEIIYKPNCELFEQSPKLYQDLQHKLARLGSDHVARIAGERSFSNLMLKVRQQLDKTRS